MTNSPLQAYIDELESEVARLRAWAEAEQAERYRAEDQRTDERSRNEQLRNALLHLMHMVDAYHGIEWRKSSCSVCRAAHDLTTEAPAKRKSR